MEGTMFALDSAVQVRVEDPVAIEIPTRSWGHIMVGVRLEKMVEAPFFSDWSKLLSSGMRPGDAWTSTMGFTAHNAANTLVRNFLESKCDSLLILDSDAGFEFGFLSALRDLPEGMEFDALQTWYPRRGWPPESIWFKRDSFGRLHNCIVLNQETTEEVAFIGTHCALIRRTVFEKMLEGHDPKTFHWFFYPRNEDTTEDAAFSYEAQKCGFKLGATSKIQINHVVHLEIGWETYWEYLETSGQVDQLNFYDRTVSLISEFLKMEPSLVMDKMAQGYRNVQEAWKKYNPQTPEQERAFYGYEDNGYLFDLGNWNSSLGYVQILRQLAALPKGRVLVVGTGIGSEAETLRGNGSQVVGFELPGILKKFSENRLGVEVPFYQEETLQEALKPEESVFDIVVAVDVIEHFTREELLGNLRGMGKALRPGGTLFMHINWEDQNLYPMHHDNRDLFQEWLKESKFEQTSDFVWRKPS